MYVHTSTELTMLDKWSSYLAISSHAQSQTSKGNPLLYSLTSDTWQGITIRHLHHSGGSDKWILTSRGMNWEGEGFVLLTAVTITAVSPDLNRYKNISNLFWNQTLMCKQQLNESPLQINSIKARFLSWNYASLWSPVGDSPTSAYRSPEHWTCECLHRAWLDGRFLFCMITISAAIFILSIWPWPVLEYSWKFSHGEMAVAWSHQWTESYFTLYEEI